MKRIKQINESKDMILQALFRLLSEKELDEITMTEIAHEANVVRMTLYRHFKTKEDILLYGFEINMMKIAAAMEEKESPMLVDLLKLRFQLLKDFKYTKLLANHNQLDKLFQSVGSKFVHHFNDLLPNFENDYIRAFIGGGIDALTERWIRDGMVESPEVVATRVNDYISKLTVV